jgi:hypothetical protein
MALPFSKHLDWLCLEGMNPKDIRKFYDNVQLPIPTDKDIEEATARVDALIIPKSVKKSVIRGMFKYEDNSYWEQHGFGELHAWRCNRPTKYWPAVGRILNHPLMRVALDVCTITGVEQEKIAIILPQTFKVEFAEPAIDLYKKIFGNFESFSKQDWTDYLARLKDDQYVYVRIFSALTKPKDEALLLCGLPAEKAFSDFLKNVLASASYKYNYYARQNTPEADAEARRWAKVGFEAGEKFEKYGAGDVSDFAKLVQTEFEYVTPEIETLDQAVAQQLLPSTKGEGDKK